ncbi:MAG: beta-N-acetylhexosaminidase [Alphaproteobacteria bacterium]|nr:beta-N-acetylhexosaminidase [Alphaproteobacteria bacterium]
MSEAEQPIPKALILGLAGLEISGTERRFFEECDPFGFILFARNCRTPDQIRALVADLRSVVGRADAPVLIDQEGGRVARLRPPHWREAPPAAVFGTLSSHDDGHARHAVRLNARLIGAELSALGIDVDCAPVLDVPAEDSHDIVGDRAFGASPALVARLGRSAIDGFLDAGVLPVIKHIPGHGRAKVDSHLELPVVDAALDALRRVDFAPFAALADAPWAMTAHVVYTALDPDNPATTSKIVVNDIIRGEIGFDGLLVSDDLSMKALSGSLAERATAALAAGCDVALHCNGEMEEMSAVAGAAGPLSPVALERIARARASLRPSVTVDVSEMQAQLDSLLSTA